MSAMAFDHGFAGASAAAPRITLRTWVGQGGFTVTSTCEFSDEMCQGKGPLFENSTTEELSSKTMSGNSELTTVDSEITKLSRKVRNNHPFPTLLRTELRFRVAAGKRVAFAARQ